ncbi:MAG: hypothetical protein N4A41_03825 [Crocinitomicaceae bacterium]|jgi:hypothetical protein|nr:hypothetical protein [Crocinitomicaceae bacterium]
MFFTLDKFGIDPTLLEIQSNSYTDLLGFSNSKIVESNGRIIVYGNTRPNFAGLTREALAILNTSNSTTEYYIDTVLPYGNIRCVNRPNQYLDTNLEELYTIVNFEKYDSNQNKIQTGILVNKMSSTHVVFWRKFIVVNNLRSPIASSIINKNESLVVVYSDSYFAPNLTGSNSKVHFLELDTNGTILRDRIFQPHTFTQVASGVRLVNNGQNYLLTYSESRQAFYAGQNTVITRPLVALLDTSLNVIWKDSITINWIGAESGIESRGRSPKNYIVQDSNFVFAHTYPYGLGMSDSIPFTSVLLENRKLFNDKTNWNRSYQYYKDTNFNNQPYYEIYDASFVPWDSGYVFVGTSYNRDSSSAGVPGQLGYVLKTNCLGHLGNPIAGASFTYNDSLGVHFESTSLQDGSVTWYFGDGSIENRGEYQDSVFHQYDSPGSQEVMLIAHGCLGVKDTLRFTIEIPEYIDPTDSTEGPEPPTVVYTKTLAIAPNPSIEGEPLSVYLGDLPDSGATLVFMEQNGKQIQKFYFPSGQSMYMLPLSLAAGVYELLLLSNGEVLDKERLVVR